MRDVIWDKRNILDLPEDTGKMCTDAWAKSQNLVLAYDKHCDSYIKDGDHKVRAWKSDLIVPLQRRKVGR